MFSIMWFVFLVAFSVFCGMMVIESMDEDEYLVGAFWAVMFLFACWGIGQLLIHNPV